MIPTMTKTNHTVSARSMGSAMRAEAGIWITGTISKMFVKNTKKKIDMRNGVYLRPSLPIVCMTMPSSTKLTDDSATFCIPDGTSLPWLPKMKIANVRITAKK